jgi:hypothetical protein
MSAGDIVPGLKFRGLYSVLYHVVGVLDDYGVLVVVLRTWRKRQKFWDYSAERMTLVLRRFDEGYYKVAK